MSGYSVHSKRKTCTKRHQHVKLFLANTIHYIGAIIVLKDYREFIAQVQ